MAQRFATHVLRPALSAAVVWLAAAGLTGVVGAGGCSGSGGGGSSGTGGGGGGGGIFGSRRSNADLTLDQGQKLLREIQANPKRMEKLTPPEKRFLAKAAAAKSVAREEEAAGR